MKKKARIHRTLVASDTHFPFVDETALEAFYSFAKWLKPDTFVHAGDLVDFGSISRFTVASHVTGHEVQEEADMCRDFLRKMRKVLPNQCECILTMGNHDIRLAHYLQTNAPALSGLRELDFDRLMGLSENEFTVIEPRNRGAYINIGKIMVGHFDKVSKHSGATAKSLVGDHFTNIVQAHVHRLGNYYITTPNSVYKGQECGCLCSLEPDYLDFCNWQQGCVVIDQDLDSNRFTIQEVNIFDGHIMFGGYEFD